MFKYKVKFEYSNRKYPYLLDEIISVVAADELQAIQKALTEFEKKDEFHVISITILPNYV